MDEARVRAEMTAQACLLASLMGRLQITGRLSGLDLQLVWRDARSAVVFLEHAGDTTSQVAGARVREEIDKIMVTVQPPVDPIP